MIYAVLLVLASITGPEPQAHVTELVEINYCYNAQGTFRHMQVICWGSYDHLPGLHVREWTMENKVIKIAPMLDGRILIFQRVYGKLQIRKGLKWKVTHTRYDPEEEDRQWIEPERRNTFPDRR